MKTKTKTKLLQTAEKIEQQLFNKTGDYWASNTTLYEINPTNPENIFGLVLIDQGQDVYELIENNTGTIRKHPLALITLGYAAPLSNNNNETRPSEHPERRRVSLFITVNKTGQMASILRFKDTNETTLDDGEARGALAEALKNLIK